MNVINRYSYIIKMGDTLIIEWHERYLKIKVSSCTYRYCNNGCKVCKFNRQRLRVLTMHNIYNLLPCEDSYRKIEE